MFDHENVVGAAMGADWDAVHRACLGVVGTVDGDILFGRVAGTLPVEDARVFRAVVRDAAGFVSAEDRGLRFATETFGIAFAVRDGSAPTRSEIVELERCIEEACGEEGGFLLHHETFSPSDLDVLAPSTLRRLCVALHEAWVSGRSVDPRATPRSTYGLRGSSPDADGFEVGFLLGVREVPDETSSRPAEDADVSDAVECLEGVFAEMVASRIPRLSAVDFPAPVGRAIPDAVLKHTVSGLCREVFDAATRFEGDATVDVRGGEGVAVVVAGPGGGDGVVVFRDVASTDLDADDVANIVRDTLPDMLKAYGEMGAVGMLPN